MVQIHSVQWAWSEACVVRHKTTFYSAATENMLGGGPGKRISSTCALSVSRGLSTLGKAISGIPRGSSGFGLEGAAWLPLKLWTTHIPCGMQKKNQSEVSVFHPQEKPGEGITMGVTSASFCKEFNLDLGSKVSQPWDAMCLLTRLGVMDCLGDGPFSAFLHFTLDTAETPTYALSSQNHRLPKWCPLLA